MPNIQKERQSFIFFKYFFLITIFDIMQLDVTHD